MASQNHFTDLSVDIPPRMEYQNGFMVDKRQGERKVLEVNNDLPYVVIRYELADIHDRAMIGTFFADHFRKKCSMFNCLKPSYDDVAHFCFDMLDHALNKKMVILAFDGIKLIGFNINTYHTPDEYENLYRGKLFDEQPIFEIKSDYGKAIDNGPFPTRKGNQIATLCGECYWQTGKFLPKDVKNLGVCEAVGTLPQYSRSRIFQRTMELSEDLFRQNNCNYVAAYCAAKGTYEYCKKRGYKTIYELPYEEFRDHGKVPFKNLSDGAEALYFQLLKL